MQRSRTLLLGPGEVAMIQLDGRNPGTATVRPVDKTGGKVIERIPVTTQDAYVKYHGTGPIHLVKIDVEGYESFVLKGGEETLRTYKPVLVVELCDQHQRMHRGSARALVGQIQALGYQIFRMGEDGSPVTEEEMDGCNMDVVGRAVAG